MPYARFTVQDAITLTEQEFLDLSEKELRSAVRSLADAGNKRIARFTANQIKSHVVSAVQRSGGKFTTAGKGLEELRSEFIRERNFFSAPSSSVSQVKKQRKEFREEIQDSTGIDLEDDQVDALNSLWEELEQVDPNISDRQLWYLIKKTAGDAFPELDNYDELIYQARQRLSARYEEMEDINNGIFNGVSDFFGGF